MRICKSQAQCYFHDTISTCNTQRTVTVPVGSTITEDKCRRETICIAEYGTRKKKSIRRTVPEKKAFLLHSSHLPPPITKRYLCRARSCTALVRGTLCVGARSGGVVTPLQRFIELKRMSFETFIREFTQLRCAVAVARIEWGCLMCGAVYARFLRRSSMYRDARWTVWKDHTNRLFLSRISICCLRKDSQSSAAV